MRGGVQMGAVAGEAVEDIGRLMRRRGDHVDVVRRALIGIMGVEAEAMIDAIAGVDYTPRCAALRAPEELAIGTVRGAIVPDPPAWQTQVRIDEDAERRAVAVVAAVGVMGPQERIARVALALRRHAR